VDREGGRSLEREGGCFLAGLPEANKSIKNLLRWGGKGRWKGRNAREAVTRRARLGSVVGGFEGEGKGSAVVKAGRRDKREKSRLVRLAGSWVLGAGKRDSAESPNVAAMTVFEGGESGDQICHPR